MNDINRESGERRKRLKEFTLADLESIRLLLRGDSIIALRRLDLADEGEAREFLVAQELRPEESADRVRMDHVKSEAVAYLRRQFDYPIPRPVEGASVPELLILAGRKGHA